MSGIAAALPDVLEPERLRLLDAVRRLPLPEVRRLLDELDGESRFRLPLAK